MARPPKRTVIGDAWYARLMDTAKKGCPLKLEQPRRFGHGNCMTAALIERPGWMAESPDGRVDMLNTMKNLGQAESLLDSAAAT